MKILVTGTEGYLGCTSDLDPTWARSYWGRHRFYKVGWLYNGTDLTALTLNKDIRHITEDLQGVEQSFMAELSNDPTGQLSPTITYDINHKSIA